MITQQSNKLLKLDGTYNSRELGGYLSTNGKSMISNKLIRSDGLHSLTSKDETFLLEYGVRTIIDLRSRKETEEKPDTLMHHTSIKYFHEPFLDRMLNNANDMIEMKTLANVYIDILQNS